MNEPTVDFLGVGAQKSATSWLSKNLRNHTDIWMPPRKELHYFDRSLEYPSPSFLASNDFKERLTSNEDHNIKFRKKMEAQLGVAKKNKDKSSIKWLERYFYEEPTDDWYRSLFLEGEGKIKGEITPAYSILNKKDISHIKKLFPNIKIILLLRDPVERAWSQVRFYFGTGRLDASASINEIKEFIELPNQITRGDYLGNLSRWQKVFPPSQFFIGYYDEVMESPKELLVRLYTFLNLDSEKSSFKNLSIKSNVSPVADMPLEINAYLVNKYLDDMRELAEVLPSEYTKKWLEKYES